MKQSLSLAQWLCFAIQGLGLVWLVLCSFSISSERSKRSLSMKSITISALFVAMFLFGVIIGTTIPQKRPYNGPRVRNAAPVVCYPVESR